MDYTKCELPHELHEFINTTTSHLRSALISNLKGTYPPPHTVNILWRNAVIDADVHFTPWTIGVAASDIGGPQSSYFQRLLELAPLPVLNPPDMKILSEHVARTPQAVSAILSLGPEVCRTLGWPYGGVRYFSYNILKLFSECVQKQDETQRKACDNILKLFQNNLLLPLIHILLGVIPQYKFAKGQLLSDRKGWVSPKEKLDKWNDTKSTDDPATALFVLLSTVEASSVAQWALFFRYSESTKFPHR